MRSKEHKKQVLILGVGNYLMGDEGVGVHIAEQLASEPLPPGIDVLDGGTGGFHLMSIMAGYRVIVIVDATIDGQEAGAIRLLEPRFAAEFPRAMSTHDIGLRDVIEGLGILDQLPKIYVLTISVSELQNMEIKLSKPVADAAALAIEQIKGLAGALLSETPGTKIKDAALLAL